MFGETSGDEFEAGSFVLKGGFAGGAEESVSGVVEFSGDERSGEVESVFGGIGATELFSSEEDVRGGRRVDSGDESTEVVEEVESDVSLGAEFDDAGRDESSAEDDDGVDHVYGYGAEDFLVGLDDDVEMISSKEGARGLDVEGVFMDFHGFVFQGIRVES